jgi:hypothetical protein
MEHFTILVAGVGLIVIHRVFCPIVFYIALGAYVSIVVICSIWNLRHWNHFKEMVEEVRAAENEAEDIQRLKIREIAP